MRKSFSIAVHGRVKNTFLHFVGDDNGNDDITGRPRSLSCPSIHCKALTKPTTMMLRKVPKACSVESLTTVLNERGFSGLYDFIYVPLDFKTRQSTGFAFINFCTEEVAQSFVDNFHLTKIANRTIKVCPARVQGLPANVEHFKNNPVNFAAEPFRPKLFQLGTGRPSPSPSPTAAHCRPLRAQPLAVPQLLLCRSTVTVSSLKIRTTAKSILEVIPNAVDVYVPVHSETGFSRGFAYVKLASSHDVNRFLNSDNTIIDGKTVGFRPFRGRECRDSVLADRMQPVTAS
ncbi:hypothetical protein FOZ60_004413 [Perkinsus olseni]|uniref:RRM domain-containing protein n=1 Tax=Perkinsus olseni TaxID=32597 RepID=A0A7J6PPR1_PEROL|nr:hypothetical protein FOZ60_004413 [Perkinsus olseni]